MQELNDLDKEQQSNKIMGAANEESLPLHGNVKEVKQSSVVCEEPMDDAVVEIRKTVIETGTEKSVVVEEDGAHKQMKEQEMTVPDVKVSNPAYTTSDLPSSSDASTTVNPVSKVESTSAEEPALKKTKFMKKKKKPVEVSRIVV
ncbi:unnamed protein product [Cylicostephanus goldi]|uniref:Uncharacterized protein n=1 Tax=Cylicostephanus goldi TaxID=71465 RepID=A0A3P7QJT0_CYLGO|nr:unnamed protein product [Cylicostephanus goldi]